MLLAAGPYVIDSYKVTIRHQNTHALCSAAFALQLGPAPGSLVTSARMFFGAVANGIFRATQTEAALIGKPLTQVRSWRLVLVLTIE